MYLVFRTGHFHKEPFIDLPILLFGIARESLLLPLLDAVLLNGLHDW